MQLPPISVLEGAQVGVEGPMAVLRRLRDGEDDADGPVREAEAERAREGADRERDGGRRYSLADSTHSASASNSAS